MYVVVLFGLEGLLDDFILVFFVFLLLGVYVLVCLISLKIIKVIVLLGK